MPPSANPVLLYDGVCGLCNRVVQFILRHDDHDQFRFTALQSPLASRLLERHGASAANLDTFYIATNFDQAGEEWLARSDAAVFRPPGTGRWLANSGRARASSCPARCWFTI